MCRRKQKRLRQAVLILQYLEMRRCDLKNKVSVTAKWMRQIRPRDILDEQEGTGAVGTETGRLYGLLLRLFLWIRGKNKVSVMAGGIAMSSIKLSCAGNYWPAAFCTVISRD